MEQKKIPQVPWLTSITNTMRFVENPIPVIKQTMEKHGDTYSFHLGGVIKTVLSSNPSFIQHFLQKNHRNYKKSQIQTKSLAFYVGNGLLTSDGEYWLQQRRLIQPGFHRAKLAGLVDIMQKVIDEFTPRLDQYARAGNAFDLSSFMMEIAFRIVARSLFSTAMTEKELHALSQNIDIVQQFLVKQIRQPYLSPWFHLSGQIKKHKTISEDSQQIILQHIKARKTSGENKNDLLDMLLNSRYEDTGEGMSDKQLLDESLILFIAGHETSANALAWTFYLLSQHPEVVEKVRKERNEKITDSTPSFSDLHKMTYTLSVINETLRLYPPAWVTDRVALQDDEINGFYIPKGTLLMAYIYGVHHSEALWKNPEQFIPERFEAAKKKKQKPFSFMPFGGGPRLCIGNNFSLMEMQLVILHIIDRYEIELIKGQDIKPKPFVTLQPESGIKVRLHKR